jgi:uncharacterized protein YndB with AHSA1/START domain
MIEREYATNATEAQQTLSIVIAAEAEKVFEYLATTEGISSWFPELSFQGDQEVLFDRGDGTYERMNVLSREENHTISYEWGTGKVTFQLVEHDGKTKLTFTEVLPFSFGAVSQDFAGWDFQIKNIKNRVETGAVDELNMEEFNRRKELIEKEIEKK